VRSLKIYWQPARGRCVGSGHGIGIYARAPSHREHLAAFVEGFAWYHGESNKAVVHFDPQLMPPGKQQFAALKAAIETRIRARDAWTSEIVPGYRTWVNG
jgi:hypothetical protein